MSLSLSLSFPHSLPTSLPRPDGTKKTYMYVRLAPDYDALDVANKVTLGYEKLKFPAVWGWLAS